MGKSSALLVTRKMLIKIMIYLFTIINIIKKNLFQAIMPRALNGTMKGSLAQCCQVGVELNDYLKSIWQ